MNCPQPLKRRNHSWRALHLARIPSARRSPRVAPFAFWQAARIEGRRYNAVHNRESQGLKCVEMLAPASHSAGHIESCSWWPAPLRLIRVL
jgi:hypothetical protein